MEQIKSQRRKGNKDVAEDKDTERYLVLVFPSRAAREQLVTSLGLPADERYLPAMDYQIRRKPGIGEGPNLPKAAPARHSGATG